MSLSSKAYLHNLEEVPAMYRRKNDNKFDCDNYGTKHTEKTHIVFENIRYALKVTNNLDKKNRLMGLIEMNILNLIAPVNSLSEFYLKKRTCTNCCNFENNLCDHALTPF